jgi:general secretion pathway protein L
LDWPVELLPGFDLPLVALATHLRPETSINLLQGAYAQSQDLQRLWAPWRVAAVLGLLWVVVALTAFGLDHWRLGREVAQQDAANLARFQELFPDETRVVDLSAQLDQRLRALSAGNGGGGLFGLIEALSVALADNAGIKLVGLQFREGALFLSLTGRDLQALEALRNHFAGSSGARLEVQSANAESGAVQIRAKLSGV